MGSWSVREVRNFKARYTVISMFQAVLRERHPEKQLVPAVVGGNTMGNGILLQHSRIQCGLFRSTTGYVFFTSRFCSTILIITAYEAPTLFLFPNQLATVSHSSLPLYPDFAPTCFASKVSNFPSISSLFSATAPLSSVLRTPISATAPLSSIFSVSISEVCAVVSVLRSLTV